MSTLNVILFLSVIVKVSTTHENVPEHPNNHSMHRMNQLVFNPTLRNYPTLANITPVNDKGIPIGEGFIGYIYALQTIPTHTLPFYSILCKKNKVEEGSKDIEILTKTIENLNREMKILENDLISLKSKTPMKECDSEPTTLKIANVRSSTLPASTLPSTFAPTSTLQSSNEVIFNSDSKTQEELSEKAFESSEKNENIQENVRQCEGVTCPSTAKNCKVSKQAIEPDYLDLKITVFCLSPENDVLLKKEKTISNPQPGVSLISSQTFDFENGDQQNKKIDDELENAMEKMRLEMLKAFGHE